VDSEVTRVRCSCILLILGVTSLVTDAQSRTSDGVAAMLRGDYQQAAAILQPIVQDRQQRDPAAAFFMATLYDTGRGVPPDPMRACALYQQAFADDTSVYAPTAQLMWRRLWMAHGNEWLQECQLVANIGIDHRFQPETFTLGAAHSVEWTLAAATVTYENRTKRTQLGMMLPRGSMFPELSPRGIDPRAEHVRRATVRILGAEFVGPAGKRIRLSRPIVLTAIVGGGFG
jgi:hypothetical protein